MENKKKTTNKVDIKKILNKVGKFLKRLFTLIKKGIVTLVQKLKEVSKTRYGKLDGNYILIGGLVVIVLLVWFISNLGNGDIDYPVIYNNTDSNLQLLTKNNKDEEDSIKLASSERADDVVYANNTNRYVLFKKKNDLYLYDSKSKDETTKIVSDVVAYMFSFDDKYVVTLDKEKSLRVYNFKETIKIEKDVSSIIGVSEDKVLYEKEKILYVRSINPKKDDRLKVTEEFDTNVRFSEDGSNIIYIDNSKKLHIFNIKKDKDTEVAKNVTKYYCDKESCTNMYYESRDDIKSIFYYDGKDSTRIAKDIYNVNAYDVEKKQLVYTKLDDGEYSLYYQKGTNEAALVENDLQGLKEVKLYDGKDIYFTTSDGELRYAKIGGSKIRVVKSIAEDVSGYLHAHKEGYVFVSDVDGGSGTLSLARSGKVKEIAEDIYTGFITIGKEGESIYYLKDYKTSGDLYVSTGGKGKLIEKDVRNYEYIHKDLIYFIRDYSTSKGAGDLYRYTNKSVKIAENVTRIASSPVYYIAK
jgi:hypothetical protein